MTGGGGGGRKNAEWRSDPEERGLEVMKTELQPVELILREPCCTVFCLVQLDHWGTIAETRSLGSGEALQGYSVFLGIPSQIRSGPFLLTCVVKRFGWGEAGRDMISSITEVKSYLHGNTALLYTLNLSST